ncbi:aspartic proteinase Asp1-like [Ananas comosus]|uniref:Aspartic proteinase Asp1 n=1 Tax=Ananas comosus TaxID=4615 RepID=A0A199UL96_ANACO|nr:aspartic proteinase Asp1-like [Ananas comosus]OAY65509.1 Aspartic proteinase Asp1 [Ananas comosus]
MVGAKRGAALMVALLIAATILAATPPCSAAAPAKKKKTKAPTPQRESGARGGPSSAVFPLYGDVYPRGLFYVSINIGDPPKPYFLDVDTGSHLTWLQCDAPCVSCSPGPHPLYKPAKTKLVPCGDPLCAALQAAATVAGGGGCGGGSAEQCDYEIEYADHGSSLGVLVSDAFSLRLANTSLARPNLVFGCGYDQQSVSSNSPAPTDGVLGLGNGKTSLPTQLKEKGITRSVVGHCLSSNGGGFLFFGDDLVPYSHASWTPMSRSTYRKYYSPGSANLLYDARSLGVKQMEAVFDSGSSYTYFGLQPYQALISKLKNDLSKTPLKEATNDHTLPLCWKGAKPFKSVQDVKKYFKTLALSFVNTKKAVLEIPPENYLIINKYGNACLAILNGAEVGLKDLNVIGDISMQDLMVVYDNEKGQIGWIRADCDRLPNADDYRGFERGFCQPQFTDMGILTDFCPAYVH